MGKPLFTPEQAEYFKSIVEGRSEETLAKMMNRKYGLNLTKKKIRSYKHNHKIRSGRKHTNDDEYIAPTALFGKDVAEFISKHYKGLSNQELTDLINTRFNTNFTRSQVKSYKNRKHLNSGLDGRFTKGMTSINKGKKMSQEQYEKCRATMFKKGGLPINTDPVGTEKVLGDGCVWVKINDERGVKKGVNWKQKHRLMWEEAYGPIPDGHYVIFLDNDPTHLTLDNLALISGREHVIMNKRGLRSSDKDLTLSGVGLVRLENTVKDKLKEVSKRK